MLLIFLIDHFGQVDLENIKSSCKVSLLIHRPGQAFADSYFQQRVLGTWISHSDSKPCVIPATIFCLDKPTYSPKVCETGKPQIYMAFYLVGQGQPLMEVCLSPDVLFAWFYYNLS